ncbi:MAG: hypothetical protein AB1391_02400 [Candidatus Micrarchaeota archaeon]
MNMKMLFVFIGIFAFLYAIDIIDTTEQKMTDEGRKAITELRNYPFIAGCEASNATKNMANSLVANSFFAIVIMVMAIALLYMVGNFFQMPNLIAMAKQEIGEIIITIFIAVFLVGFIFASVFYSPSSQNSPNINFFQQATDYSYRVLHKISYVSSIMMTSNMMLNSVYSLYIPLGPVHKSMSMQLGPALRPLIDGVSFCLQFLITSYGEWVIFLFMFCFIQKWFIPLFFPFGLFLRTFPHTRGGGNALIAISIALSTIYPFMFYVDSLIFEDQFPHSSGLGGYVTEFSKAVTTLFTGLGVGAVASLFIAFSFIYLSSFMVSAILLITALFYNVILETVHLVMIFSIILPIFNVFLTLTFAREIAKMLGTEISISAFAKVI